MPAPLNLQHINCRSLHTTKILRLARFARSVLASTALSASVVSGSREKAEGEEVGIEISHNLEIPCLFTCIDLSLPLQLQRILTFKIPGYLSLTYFNIFGA